MATKSFGNTFKITTKYGIKNFKKAMENSTHQKKENIIDTEKYIDNDKFVQKLIKNLNGN